ncbi:hypothetical protein MW290_10390 [Aquincola tertiaricarbonis]|uniref:Glycosyltransferase n=1 Tax=Aquincola tertiaricarbonis TaxID=391953 RepID=A0ABY4S379_AQUTE|nr:hypothetical protein [Aquincola tertiaricarbonis]URI06327.1 hypothetical protein MW290_10390 [Aquincola tertiaricarbonis]
MNIDALLFLQHSDIAHFCNNPAPYAGLKQIFIDPGLVDEAARAGLDPALFEYRPLQVGRHCHSRNSTQAMTRAQAIDQQLTRERERLFGDGMLAGWDHGPLRFFFLRALIARHLGEACEGHFPERAVGVFRPRKPQQFYFDSYVSTDTFCAASDRWRVVDHYDDVAHWVDDASAHCFDFTWLQQQARAGRAQAVVHIPTVYANLPHFVAEIARRHNHVLELPSPFWDIPLSRERQPLAPVARMAAEWAGPECAVYRERARALYMRELADLLTQPEALRRQAELFADQCYLQAVNYQGLMRALQGSRPHFILTDHDTGAMGPLFSVAAQLGSEVTVLPHSSYPTQPLPHGLNVTAIERDGFASPVRTVWGARVKTRPVRLSPRRNPPVRPAVKTVCLLLNALSGRGISHVDFIGMAQFHKALAQRCAQAGVQLLVRLKPGAACLPVVAGTLGQTPEALQQVMALPIDQLAQAADVCICHGELTSGAIEFFESGSYVMHVSEEIRPNELPSASSLSTLASLPPMHGPEALQLIDQLLDGSGRFVDLLAAQRAEFAPRLTAADGRLFDA